MPALLGDYTLINTDKEEVILKENNQEVHFSLKQINEELIKKYHKNDNSELRSDELTFILTEKNRTIKLLLQNYSFKNPDYT